jgi:hypothetical protein
MSRSLVNEFLVRNPSVDGYTLIAVCEEINRRTKAAIGVRGILEKALMRPQAEQYLVRVCESIKSQETANV